MTAIQYNQKEIVKTLIDKGADVNSFNEDEDDDEEPRTPLQLAISSSQYGIIEILLGRGSAVETDSPTPLWHAARQDDRRLAKLLLDAGANPNFGGGQDDGFCTPLLVAAHEGSVEVADLLLSYGADANQGNSDGDTPLIMAAREGKPGIMALLNSLGADLNKSNNRGFTPLITAVEEEKLEMVNILLGYGAEVDKPYKDGRTPLMYAVGDENIDICKALLLNGADAERKPPYGNYLLLSSVIGGELEMVKILLFHGARKGRPREGSKKESLDFATSNGNAEICEALLKSGADVEQLRCNLSPLWRAAQRDHLDLVKVLVRYGASVDRIVDPKQHTAVAAAAYGGHVRVIKCLIEECGASAVPPHGWDSWNAWEFCCNVEPVTQKQILRLLNGYYQQEKTAV